MRSGAFCVLLHLCVFCGAQCNHSSNLSARNLCVGDIKVLISAATRRQCHCEDTDNTSTPAASTHRVCVRVCVCQKRKPKLHQGSETAHTLISSPPSSSSEKEMDEIKSRWRARSEELWHNGQMLLVRVCVAEEVRLDEGTRGTCGRKD